MPVVEKMFHIEKSFKDAPVFHPVWLVGRLLAEVRLRHQNEMTQWNTQRTLRELDGLTAGGDVVPRHDLVRSERVWRRSPHVQLRLYHAVCVWLSNKKTTRKYDD